MSEMIIRVLKGFFMAILFGAFLLGIFLQLLVVLPILLVLDRFLGAKPVRMQETIRFLVRLWLFLLNVFGLLRARGIKGRPIDQPCVVVSNHPGLFDVLFLIRDIPRMSVMVKKSLATKLPLGPVIRSAGYVLSPDFDQRGPFQCLEEALEKIRAGYKFMIFPEATRSPKGELRPFRAGPFMMARLANVPIQPIFIKGDPPFLPKEDQWYYPPSGISNLTIEFWEPIAPPGVGQERQLARDLELRYRQALGVSEIQKV